MTEGWLSAREAAERLGIKPATLYAYVSRGLLHPRRASDRASRYDPAEVRRVAARGRRSRQGEGPSELWIESALTLIRPHGHYYRGRSAIELVAGHRFEDVAELLWTNSVDPEPPWRTHPAALTAGRGAQSWLPPDTLPLERMRVIAAMIATTDHLRHDISLPTVLVTFRALLAGLVDCLETSADAPPDSPLARRLAVRLAAEEPSPAVVHAVDSALILLADHELTASTLAARAAASVRADPYAVVLAGLGAVSGPLHGAASLSLETLLGEVGTPERAARAVGERLRRGERLVGFGHPLYPEGDPRAGVLLEQVRATARAGRWAIVDAVGSVAAERGLAPPNVDFALAALSFCCGLIGGAGEAMFAIARSAGWLAHALEAYGGKPVRPRAVYVGPPI